MIDTNIPVYDLCILLSLILNAFVISIIAKKFNYTKLEIFILILYETVGIIFGGKLLSFIENYPSYKGDIGFMVVGFRAFGAVTGALIFIYLSKFQLKKTFKELLYICLPSVPLMYAIGKIGCFLVGCCHGIEYSKIGSVVYKYSFEEINGIQLFPVQLVESIIFFIIFIFIMIRYKKNKINEKTLGLILILSGSAKFILYYFRMEHLNSIFTSHQILSFIFIILGIVIYLLPKKEKTLLKK
ncbi:MAG: prolipoprotein diacylglyceryl transferase family protein [Bacilli bacterium]